MSRLLVLYFKGCIDEDQLRRYAYLTQQWEEDAKEEGWIGVGVITYV